MSLPSKIPSAAKLVFSGVVFDVYQWQQELFDGSFTTFEMASRANAVSIIPVIDEKFVVLHEEQPGRLKNIGFPGGHIDPGEDPLTAAIRELHEETGMTFKTVKLVGLEDIGGHKVDWWCFRYVAYDLEKEDEPHNDPGEKITVELMDFAKAKTRAENNIYMSHTIMEKVESVEELLALPEIEV